MTESSIQPEIFKPTPQTYLASVLVEGFELSYMTPTRALIDKTFPGLLPDDSNELMALGFKQIDYNGEPVVMNERIYAAPTDLREQSTLFMYAILRGQCTAQDMMKILPSIFHLSTETIMADDDVTSLAYRFETDEILTELAFMTRYIYETIDPYFEELNRMDDEGFEGDRKQHLRMFMSRRNVPVVLQDLLLDDNSMTQLANYKPVIEGIHQEILRNNTYPLEGVYSMSACEIDLDEFSNDGKIAETEGSMTSVDVGLTFLRGFERAGLSPSARWFYKTFPGMLPVGDKGLEDIGISSFPMNKNYILMETHLSGAPGPDALTRAGMILLAFMRGGVSDKNIQSILPGLFPEATVVSAGPDDQPTTITLKPQDLELYFKPVFGQIEVWLSHLAKEAKRIRTNPLMTPEEYITIIKTFATQINMPPFVADEIVNKNALNRLTAVVGIQEKLLVQIKADPTISPKPFYHYSNANVANFTYSASQIGAEHRHKSATAPQPPKKDVIEYKKGYIPVKAEVKGKAQERPQQHEKTKFNDEQYDTRRAAVMYIVDSLNTVGYSDEIVAQVTLALNEASTLDLGIDQQDLLAFINKCFKLNPAERSQAFEALLANKQHAFARLQELDIPFQDITEEQILELAEAGEIEEELINLYSYIAGINALLSQ